jgi:branched-chain amino acid transport system ATP-binding protein
MTNMLEVEGIDVFYGPIQALRGVTMHVGEGEMVALLGANGAGKTTTLRAISGVVAPTQGSIRIGGKEAAGAPAQRVVRMGVAHLPEGRELFGELSVIENLRLGHWPLRKDKKDEHELLEEMFELFPRLKERAHQASATLSGGEQQMLAVARALMSKPKLLLVDELSLGLAPIIVQQLFEAIAEVNRRGTAVLLVEQFVHVALRYTSRAYALGRGEVVLEGKSSDLLASPDLLAAYLGESVEEPAAEEPAPKPRTPKAKSPNGKTAKAGGKPRRTGSRR